MSKSYRHTTTYITKAAFIAALYVVLTELSALFGLSGTNVIQFRLSEALTVFAGEFVCCGILGMLLLFAVNRHADLVRDKEPEPRERRTFKEVFPAYVWICFAYLLIIDLAVFYGTRPFLPYLPAHELATPVDAKIPFLPPWIIVYVLSFVSWLVTIIWILAESKKHAYRLCGVYTIIVILSGICFLAYPVTIQRPEITEPGLFNDWMRLLYRLDAPQNLCPSFHVVISYICWRCTMDCKKISKWYQWFNLIFLILVCFCILFVKQHYLIDIPVALVITEGAIQIGRLTRIERIGFAIENRFRKRPAAE